MTTWAKVFDWNNISAEDRETAARILGDLRQPDLVISPAGTPYLYRWFVVRDQEHGTCNVYFHVQVAHDPERPLHDHPWDNQSVILAGGYGERICMESGRPTQRNTATFTRKKGDVIWRKADWSHRLFLPPAIPYTMTLFSTGPKVRKWGFWYPEKWLPFEEVTRVVDGQSVHFSPVVGNVPGDVVGAY
jgi:hypothetical protein